MRSRQIFILVFSFTISISLLIWVGQGVQWWVVWNIVQGLQLQWVALSLFTFLCSFYLRANRWGHLIRQPSRQNTLHLRQAAIFIGFGSNCVLPFNAGELIRTKLVSQMGQLPFSLVLGSLVSERLLDAGTAFSLLALSGVVVGTASSNLWLSIGGLGVILVVLILLFYSLGRWQEALLQFLQGQKIPFLKPHWKQKGLTILGGILKSFTLFNRPLTVAIALGQSYLIWGLGGLSFWLMMQAFNWGDSNIFEALFVMSLQAIAAVIPSSPGQLGTFEAAMNFALSLIDISKDAAIAYTLVMRVMMYGSLIIFGLLYAFKLGIQKVLPITQQSQENTSAP